MGRIRASMAFDDLRGSAGGVTVTRGRTGLVTQSAPKYRRPISPAQAASMARMETAGLAWNELPERCVEEWRRYAKGIVRHGDVSGAAYHPLAFNLFSGLYCKTLQIDPEAAPPMWPPQGPFLRDRIGIEVQGSAEGLLYVASGPNRPGVLTELLYQKLPSRHRVPKPKYKSAGFRAFTEAERTFVLPLEPGYYACAYAFVEASTGLASTVWPIGTVHVPDAAGV